MTVRYRKPRSEVSGRFSDRTDGRPPEPLILLSGGLDSAVVALMACEGEARPHFLSFEYQQQNRRELDCSLAVAKKLSPSSPHHRVSLDFAAVARGSDSGLLREPGVEDETTDYYVPGRNLVFLAHAAAVAESYGLVEIHLGSTLQDARAADRAFPDARPEFLGVLQEAIGHSRRSGESVRIVAPLLDRPKFDAIRFGHQRGFDFALTWSCYRDGPMACGACPACRERLMNFHWAGLADPLPYRDGQTQALARALS